MKRRDFIFATAAALPASPALAGTAQSKSDQEIVRERMISVIEQLESGQGWEPSATVAAKAFVAWQMRKALGLELPDRPAAQMHVEFQHMNFQGYRHSARFEQDRAAGKHYAIPPMERALD
ncbi:hypothetical protein K4K94_12460 [Phaeobacter inhibens]|uniref:hypothetical protein n=1 Tax=Phaeobacter inhibens TaxID=221822 RepID=UPI0021A4C595|nr:hypothetical protein [Phaeobacter inhibens]UWS03112.1 hypothetical protein K4K94_12460 [Phaeobacter inhibens]